MGEMIEVAQATVTIIPNLKGAQQKITEDLGGVPEAGEAIGTSFAKKLIGAIGSLKIGATIVDGIKSSIEQGAALQQSIGGIETLFKDSADKVKKNASQAFKNAGMSANEYMENVTSFAASLTASLGGDTEKAAEAADRALRDMSDNANKMGTNMDSIVQTYQSLSRGNFAMLDSLKIGYGGTKSEMQRLLKDTAKMTDIQKKLGISVDATDLSFGNMVNAISVMQEKLGIAGATANEAATTLSGSLASMGAAWNDLLGNLAIGESLEEPIKNLATTVSTFLFDNLIPMVGNIATGIVKAIPTAVTSIASSIASALPKVKESVATVVSNIISALPGFINMISSSLNSAIDMIFSNFSKTESIMAAATNIVTNLAQSLLNAGASLVDSGIDLVNKIKDGLSSNAGAIASSASNIVRNLIDTFIKVGPDFIKQGVTIVAKLVEGLLSALPSIALSAVKIALKLIATILSKLPDILAAGIKLAKELVTGFIDHIPKLLGKVGDAVNKIVKKIGKKFKETDWKKVGIDIIRGIVKGLKKVAGEIWDFIKAICDSVYKNVKGFFTGKSMQDRAKIALEDLERKKAEQEKAKAGGTVKSVAQPVESFNRNIPPQMIRDQSMSDNRIIYNTFNVNGTSDPEAWAHSVLDTLMIDARRG
jgi:phage-related protein